MSALSIVGCTECSTLNYGIENAQMIASHRIFLDRENPRVEKPFETEDQAIAWLCENEDVLTLAKDIREIGPNPLELVAVMKKGNNSYIALEGNRRVCALMLLNDPDRAPSGYKDRFHAVAEGWTPVKELFCVQFPNRDFVQVWLDRIHGGKDGGRGRSSWSSDVKTRRTQTASSRSNKLPLSLLDYGVAQGLIAENDRKGKLAIMQRFSSNPVFKNMLGIKQADDGFSTELPKADFDKLLGKLLMDMVSQDDFKAHKYNKNQVEEYANSQLAAVETSGKRQEAVPLSVTDNSSPATSSPSRPSPPTKIAHSQSLENDLVKLGNYKLRRLYYSLTKLSAKDHCPLLYVGFWSLVECLTALDGRNSKTDFTSYLSPQRLQDMGLGDKNKTRAMRDALSRVSAFGNGTKHDGEAAGFNSEQLVNDFQVVEKLLKKLVAEILAKPAH